MCNKIYGNASDKMIHASMKTNGRNINYQYKCANTNFKIYTSQLVFNFLLIHIFAYTYILYLIHNRIYY